MNGFVAAKITFTDPTLRFDATNWLSDEKFVDLESGDFTWDESRQANDQSRSKAMSCS